jgi:hypothetical protein
MENMRSLGVSENVGAGAHFGASGGVEGINLMGLARLRETYKSSRSIAARSASPILVEEPTEATVGVSLCVGELSVAGATSFVLTGATEC